MVERTDRERKGKKERKEEENKGKRKERKKEREKKQCDWCLGDGRSGRRQLQRAPAPVKSFLCQTVSRWRWITWYYVHTE
jgi:hypothetical protein